MIRKTFQTDEKAVRCIDRDLYDAGWNIIDNRVELVDIDFHEGATDIIKVYIGDDNTYIVVDNTDFKEILIFKVGTIEYYAKWERFVLEDIRSQQDLSHIIFWFNIGQDGDHMVQWQSAMIDGNFRADSIRVESYDEDGNEIWVKPDSPFAYIPSSVDGCFDDIYKVARAVEDSYYCGEDVHFQGRNTLHIYDCFDMNDKNEYGVAKPLWG